MINKPFDLIEKADIDALVANEVREGRNMNCGEDCQETRIATNWNFLVHVLSLLIH